MTLPKDSDGFALRLTEHLFQFHFLFDTTPPEIDYQLVDKIADYLINHEEAMQGSDYTPESLERWLDIATFIYGYERRYL